MEDSAVQAENVRTFLEAAGYDTQLAADGRAALAAIRAVRPDLILADVNMPVMSGFELCRFVKNHPAFRTIPVILLTTLADPRDLLEGLEAGADAYLFKPFRNGELLERLSAHRHGPPPSNADCPTTAFTFRGRDYRIEGGARVLDFLISVYESARRQNEELIETRQRLLETNGRLEELGIQLVESERLASIGQIAAGVAHQVNNPIGYVKSNLVTLERYFDDLLRLIDAYATGAAEPLSLRAAMDFEFTREDAPRLIAESLEGTQRVAASVEDLRRFSNLDAWDDWRPDNLHAGLDATLNLFASGLAGGCEIRKEYGPLPLVECRLPQLNHMFVHLVQHLAAAGRGAGVIVIRTSTADERVTIELCNPGLAVAAPDLARLRDRLYSPDTSVVSSALSLTRSTLAAHQGAMEVDSGVDSGTIIRVVLPIRHATPQVAEAVQAG